MGRLKNIDREEQSRRREAARAAGAKTFVPIYPCPKGHQERSVASNECLICTRESTKRCYQPRERKPRPKKPEGLFHSTKPHSRCGTTLRRGKNGYSSCALCSKIAQNLSSAHERRGITLKVADVVSIWKDQKGLCFYCDKELVYTHSSVRQDSMTLDRVDSSKGYEPGNVVLACHRCNSVKSDSTLSELRQMVQRLEAFAKDTSPRSSRRHTD